MSRKACKRRIRPASAPALVKLAAIPAIGVAEHMAIEALRLGFFEYQHYRVVADCHSHLTLAAAKNDDQAAKDVCAISGMAMRNIYDRYQKTRRYDASGDELQSIMLLINFSDDFWKRQSGALLDECIAITEAIRTHQLLESRKKAA